MPRVASHERKLKLPRHDESPSSPINGTVSRVIGDVDPANLDVEQDEVPDDSHVSIRRVDRHWSLNTAEGSTTWTAPPAVLGHVLLELFATQPKDVLHWFHNAAWRMHAEEIEQQLLCARDASSMHGLLSAPAEKPTTHSWWALPPGTGNVPSSYERVRFANASEEEHRRHAQNDFCKVSNPDAASIGNHNLTGSITGLAHSAASPFTSAASAEVFAKSLAVINREKGPQQRAAEAGGWGPSSPSQPATSDYEKNEQAQPETNLDTSGQIDDDIHFRPGPPLFLSRNPLDSRNDQLADVVRRTSTGSEANEVLHCSDRRASQAFGTRGSRNSVGRTPGEETFGVRGSRESDGRSPGVPRLSLPSVLSATGHDSMRVDNTGRMNSIRRAGSIATGIKAITSLFSTPAHSAVSGHVSTRMSDASMHSSYSYISFKQHFKSVKAMGSFAGSSGGLTRILHHMSSETEQRCQGISPTSLVYLCWNLLFCVFLVFEMWAVPFDLVFLEDCDRPHWLDVADVFLLGFFSMDVIMNCITGFVKSGYIVRPIDLILMRYIISPWFVIDLAATLPYAIVMGMDGKAARFFIFLRLLRLHRVIDMARSIFRLLAGSRLAHKELWIIWHPLLVLLLIKLQVVLLLVVHVYAVLWAAVTAADCEATGAYERYYECVWWAFITLTWAHGSVATTRGQRGVDILAALARLCLLLFVFIEVHSAMVWIQEILQNQTWRHEILKYIRQRGASVEMDILVDTMLCNFDWTRTQQQHYDRLNQQPLPAVVKKHLAEELWEQKLITMGLIHPLVVWENSFASQLAEHVREDLIPPGVTLFATGELSHSAYLVLYGTFSAVDPVWDELPDYTRDMWVGEHALVNPELLRSETITCKDRAALMSVMANDFRKLVARNGLAERFENMLQKTLWMGLCGRCGFLGDHFAKDCPLLHKRSWYRRFWRLATLRSFKNRKDDSADVSPELLRFLEDHQLIRYKSAFVQNRIKNLTDLNAGRMTDMINSPAYDFSPEEKKRILKSVKRFREKVLCDTSDVLLSSGDVSNHLMFLSHYKVEAGTEAALMQKDLEKFIQETPGSPGHDLENPVFVDTENLRDLNDLQDCVRRSHNLVLLLTPGVLTRPWVLVEIVTAVNAGVNIIPVEVQRPDLKFQYPGDEYYQRLRNGEEHDPPAMDLLASEGIDLVELEGAIRQVFKRIATPFSPHKTAGIRDAELREILKQCTLRELRHRGFGSEMSAHQQKNSLHQQARLAGPSQFSTAGKVRQQQSGTASWSHSNFTRASSERVTVGAGGGKKTTFKRSGSRDLSKLKRLSTAAMNTVLDKPSPLDLDEGDWNMSANSTLNQSRESDDSRNHATASTSIAEESNDPHISEAQVLGLASNR